MKAKSFASLNRMTVPVVRAMAWLSVDSSSTPAGDHAARESVGRLRLPPISLPDPAAPVLPAP